MRGKPAQMWRLINKTCGRGDGAASLPTSLMCDKKELTDPVHIANELNRHFASVGHRTTDHIGHNENFSEVLGDLQDVGEMYSIADFYRAVSPRSWTNEKLQRKSDSAVTGGTSCAIRLSALSSSAT